MSTWYQLNTGEVLDRLGVGPDAGLDEREATSRLVRVGSNELIDRGLKSAWLILWEQLTSTMMVVLMIAALISVALGDYKDATAILAMVLLNALLGFSQEFRAEKGIAGLKRLAVPTVRVLRSGRVVAISASTLVPGDIVLLEAGGFVPADCRLLESSNLRIQEAALTGESEPVPKSVAPIVTPNLEPADQVNMAFMGTMVSYGRGSAVVTETGMRTELGHIAAMIQMVSREATPLQRRLDRLGKNLALVAFVLVAVIFTVGVLRGVEVGVMFLTAVSIAVAAIPEGLPAVVTIALALGAQRMVKRNALIRRLPAVETLGSVTVVCSDKTGTLTENRMTAVTLWLPDAGFVDLADGRLLDLSTATTAPLLAGSALCTDAIVGRGSPDGEVGMIGDPTEIALVRAATRFGLDKQKLAELFPRVAEVPFESNRRRMTTIHAVRPDSGRDPLLAAMIDRYGLKEGSSIAFTKGAVDSLLDVSGFVSRDERREVLDEPWRRRISDANDEIARSGKRVLGVAFRLFDEPPSQTGDVSIERDLNFLGMVGMIDPPRSEAKDAVAICDRAGIRPIIVTGDHPLTASYIAREVGVATDERVISGNELIATSDEDLEKLVGRVSVYARVSPATKLRIVRALQNNGHVVAMTGDGVNDAPALKKADIGVAMGLEGTDVAKDAADMVLLDDNFATIVTAVREGRVIYDNIRKFIKYMLATNSAEIWVMLLSPFTGITLPLLPLQILWMNFVTDGLPALALGVEPAEPDVMSRAPHGTRESIFSRGLGRHVVWAGLLMCLLSLGVGWLYYRIGRAEWQTMLFTTLTICQMAHILAIRSETRSLLKIGPFSNKPLLGAVVLTVVLQLALIYAPVMQRLFRTTSLSATDLLLSFSLSAVVFFCVELEKLLRRQRTERVES
jgi:P-type Ca2+ transporter type 2C